MDTFHVLQRCKIQKEEMNTRLLHDYNKTCKSLVLISDVVWRSFYLKKEITMLLLVLIFNAGPLVLEGIFTIHLLAFFFSVSIEMCVQNLFSLPLLSNLVSLFSLCFYSAPLLSIDFSSNWWALYWHDTRSAYFAKAEADNWVCLCSLQNNNNPNRTNWSIYVLFR